MRRDELLKEATIPYGSSSDVIANADIVIAIDQRGVARVVKHRHVPTNAFDVEVKLTRREPVVERYVSKTEPTLNLASDADIERTVSTSKRVAVTQDGIRSLLEDAVLNQDNVLISGTKVQGERYYNREVTPLQIVPATIRRKEYLIVHDPDADKRRTFYLGGIERAEVVG